MELNGKRLLIAAHYAAPYEGNFIASLYALERNLKERFNVKCAFLFPCAAKRQSWIDSFMAKRTVFFSGDSSALISQVEADRIINDFDPDVIYTHFEGYDLPLFTAVKRCGKQIKQVWHLHDTLSFHPNPIKAVYQIFCYFRHYGYPVLCSSGWGGKTLCYSCLRS